MKKTSTRRRLSIVAAVAVLCWLAIAPSIMFTDESAGVAATLDSITAAITDGDAVVARIDDDTRTITVDLKNGTTKYSGYPSDYGDELIAILDDAGVPVDVDPKNVPSPIQEMLLSLLPLVVFGGLIMIVARRYSAGTMRSQISRSADQLNSVPPQRFSDVAGCDEAVEDLREVVEFLKDTERFERLGAHVPRGLLLVGPPGTGKTMLARATAGEAGVPFFAISGSDFVEMFVGVGASRVRTLFDKARKAGRAIVFIDEIDAIGKQRGGHSGFAGGNDERESTLNALLVEMDGFAQSGVVVLAATNRVDVLDSALLRPGRFDRRVIVGLPDRGGRQTLFKMYLANATLEDGCDIEHLASSLAKRSTGMSGADIGAVVNEAALIAARRSDATGITDSDAEDALERIALGRERRSVQMTENEQKVTAWHEAGHALVALSVNNASPVERVSVVPRGAAGGATWFSLGADEHFTTRTQAVADLAVAFGGRAAEMLLLDGDFTQGAANDIAQATRVAEKMVFEWGMSPIGPVYIDKDRQLDIPDAATAAVRELLDTALATALECLSDRRMELDAIAHALIEHETLSAADLDDIIRKTR